MKKYKIQLQENIDPDDILILSNYLEKKINIKNFKKSDRIGPAGREIDYIYYDQNSSEYFYSIMYNENIPAVQLNFVEKLIIPGDSLADPRASYQTTSARTFKKKTRRLNKIYESTKDLEKKGKKDIDKFFK